MDSFMSVPLGQMAYQPFGDLAIDLPGHERSPITSGASTSAGPLTGSATR